MNEYTPRTEDVCENYQTARYNLDAIKVDTGRAEFDSWLIAHDRAVATAAWDEGWIAAREDGNWGDDPRGNPYRAVEPQQKEGNHAS